ncbi:MULTISPECIES: tripartite tricarboxylate transporter TctB family protein [Thermus]|uniref:tripartite tricarboxylate transporter TctB family protein n=1 Tax=Thermus TaxID=270 RepID=UPI001F2AAA25|nr:MULTISPECIES: tripartite tricarboxylate transporter TctB family protein [Thermus]
MGWGNLVGVLAAGLGTLAWVLSLGLPKAEGPGPELFPRVLGTALVLGGLYLLWEKAEGLRIRLEGAWLRVLFLTLLFLLAPALVPRAGIALATAIAAGVGTLLAGEGWYRALLTALGLWLLAYGVFVRLLGVPA